MNKRIDKLVFDVDGTLFDTKPGIMMALEEVFERFQLGVFDKAIGSRYIGPPICKSLMSINGLTYNDATEAAEYYRKVYIEKYIVHSKAYDGAFETLSRLKASGYSINIATMKTKSQIDKLLGLNKRFIALLDEIKTASDDGTLKKADMLVQLKPNNRRKSSMVMVGDTLDDKDAAMEAKISFIGATYGYGLKNDKYAFPTINDIRKIDSVL